MKRKALSEWVRRRFDGSWVAAQAASENADAPLDDRFLRRFSDSGERLDADESSDDEAPSRHRPPKGTHAAKEPPGRVHSRQRRTRAGQAGRRARPSLADHHARHEPKDIPTLEPSLAQGLDCLQSH